MPSGVSGSKIADFAWKIADEVASGVKDVRAAEKKADPSSTSRADKYVESWNRGKKTANEFARFQAWQDRSK